MAFTIRHETNPVLLGQGAYAGGLAEYDRRREQLALQYSQMAQQRAMQQASMQANAVNQHRAQEAARERQMAQLQAQGMMAGQEQDFRLNLFQEQAANRAALAEQQEQAKIRLSDHAYKLKQAERDRQIMEVTKTDWDEGTKANAIAKINLGFSKYEAEPQPTFQEQMEQMTGELEDFIVLREDGGRVHLKEKPRKDIGQHTQRMINGVMVDGQINKDGMFEPYEKPKEPKDTSGDQAKALTEAYKRARAAAEKKFLDPENMDPAALQAEIEREYQMEQAFMQKFGGGGQPMQGQEGHDPAQQMEMQGQAGHDPAQQAEMIEFATASPNYPGVDPNMNPQQMQMAAEAINQDMMRLKQLYNGDKEALQQNPQHYQIYLRLQQDLIQLTKMTQQAGAA